LLLASIKCEILDLLLFNSCPQVLFRRFGI
jgi:hypothetical protein